MEESRIDTNNNLFFIDVVGVEVSGAIVVFIRLLLIFGGLLVLTLPSEYEGLRLLIAVAAMLAADRLSGTLPNAVLGRRSFEVVDYVSETGSTTRLALLDCSCE